MTFLEAQTMALIRVDESIEDVEAVTLTLIKDAINNAYLLLAGSVDKRTATKVLALEDYNNKLPLPLDFVEIVMVEHELLGEISKLDYEKRDDILFFKSKDMTSGDITLTYVCFPGKLVNDTDVLRLKDAYTGAVSAYAGYVYQLGKKKYSAAQMLLQEFNLYMPNSNIQAVQAAQNQE